MAACSSEDPATPSIVLNTAPGTGGANAFSLELVQVYGGDETAVDARSLIGYVGSVSVLETGDVYVLDAQSSDIVTFSSDGAVKWRKGEPGEGPGEIQRPNKLIATPEELVLVNQGGGRIDRYDLEGTYQSTSSRPQSFSLECILSDGRLLGDDAIRGEWKLNVLTMPNEYDSDSPSLLFDVTYGFDEPAGSGAAIAVTACAGNEILVVNPGAYLIDRYSLDGSYLGSFGRSDVGWNPPITVTAGASVTAPSFLPNVPLGLGDGGYFIVAQWLRNADMVPEMATAMLNGTSAPAREWQYSLDLYDRKGTLVGTQSGDGEAPIGRPVAANGHDTIYTYVHSPVPQVRRYKIVLQ